MQGGNVPTYAPAPGTIGRRRVAQAMDGQWEAIELTIMRPVTMVGVTWAMGMYGLYDLKYNYTIRSAKLPVITS